MDEAERFGHPLGGMSTINEFCQRNSIGRSYVYEQIRDGKLKAVKAGSKTLITFDEELRWRKSLPQTLRPVEHLRKSRSNPPSAQSSS
jgi:excisionase family DNA binding protein